MPYGSVALAEMRRGQNSNADKPHAIGKGIAYRHALPQAASNRAGQCAACTVGIIGFEFLAVKAVDQSAGRP